MCGCCWHLLTHCCWILAVCLSVWMDSAHGIGVQLIPQNPVVNQSVTLSVTGVTGTIRLFTWYKGSSTDANVQIFSVIPSVNSVTNGLQYFPRASQFPNGSLQISGLVPTDQGNYTVFIQTIESTAQHTVLLTVYEPVTSSVISTNNKEPQEKEKVTLTCSANNAENILWSKDGAPVPPGLILSADNRTVSFSSVSRSDTGQYRCEALNAVSKIISDPYTLTVNYGPENLKMTDPQQVTIGKSFSLECSADSVPAPAYLWKFNGTNLDLQNNILHIHQATYENAGNYTCIVTNSVIKLSQETSVYVTVNENDPNDIPIGTGSIVGIVIAVILVVALVTALFLLLGIRRRHRSYERTRN
ncbi:carcinoembryonic antigen-related cell adhesion molecule 5-like isoform X2 [Xenopus laevis]|uniref:Carcinoembryonic antigen-related cell adhesion molecule 5-like isoform X2 n=1 Tax=Xenopus laevis TaxID=8355 RepID=A0A8J1LES5_XENLA|nr:carcinoembryonic antigen-related cell adhesion molecule 5-like isoform X2 [Xenopus laevis]